MHIEQAILTEPPKDPAQPELLVSALLHLMSHYTANLNESGACLKMAAIIERHLQALAGMPQIPPVLRATCDQLTEQWSAIVERSLPIQEKTSLITRLIAAARLA